MRTTPIGFVMMNDERPHVLAVNESENMAVLERWAAALAERVRNLDGTAPELVLGSETVKSVRSAQAVGEQLRRTGCRSVVLCFNVWNFPYLVWPLLNTLGPGIPILSLSNDNGAYPGNVGLLATDGALRQAGMRTHRIVGDIAEEADRKSVV